MLLAALRRFLTLLVATVAVVALFSLAVGLLLGASANRSISLGLYVVGCFVMLVGFFFGMRGPIKPADSTSAFSWTIPFFGGGPGRAATSEEQRETFSLSALYVVLGLALLTLAIVIDSRNRLV
jgi:hypothetical protein